MARDDLILIAVLAAALLLAAADLARIDRGGDTVRMSPAAERVAADFAAAP